MSQSKSRGETAQWSGYIPKGLRDRLREEAKKRGKDQNSIVETALERELRERREDEDDDDS